MRMGCKYKASCWRGRMLWILFRPPMSARPAAPDVTLIFGPMLIGVLLNTMLYGIMIVQAFLYYSRYKGDRPWFRHLVLYLVLAETANWVCDVGIVYEPLVIRYGTPEALQSPLLLRADGVLTVLISTPVQLFIAWRIRVVTRSYVLPGFIALLAIISFGGGLATSLIVSLFPASEKITKFRTEIIIWLVSSTIHQPIDILIVVFRVFFRVSVL
ncbi:hypothetical protein DFH08DRAFT_854521 [Mycena albidolilacea]|uniref:Uncharacterized protein n=1 Tax=Mycena albidolilacea TaxID=1033008 RepID=A0AAD7ABM1_9AGAR|nr:hypothetical protein DFH08DRAFT_854521 [Mycena albidolilacea]